MAARIDTSRAADIRVICGSSGSGKSWHVKTETGKARRLCVWDPDDEYGGEVDVTVTRAAELLDWLKRYPKGALRIRYVATGAAAFNLWAKAVFAWGNCDAVAEEIAGTTSPSKAPPGWHTLVTRGRKRGIRIFAVTQRPVESDKTVMGNATRIRVGRLARAADRKYMAAELDTDQRHVNDLRPLEYLERDMMKNTVVKGKQGTKRRPVPVNG